MVEGIFGDKSNNHTHSYPDVTCVLAYVQLQRMRIDSFCTPSCVGLPNIGVSVPGWPLPLWGLFPFSPARPGGKEIVSMQDASQLSFQILAPHRPWLLLLSASVSQGGESSDCRQPCHTCGPLQQC